MPNTYTVIMLGPSGSGKTVFLASMDKKLSVEGDLGFFLHIDSAEKRKRLKNIYTQIAADERWPKSTDIADVSEWVFTCKVQTPNLGIYPACQFTYLDYSGERLTEEMDTEDTDFDQKIQTADALLGLLDGTRIISLMKKERLGNLWSIKDLPNMLTIMQNSNKPVHFVVSKWDIVQNDCTLEDICKCLLEIEEFKNFVELRQRSNSPIRLIPVSSVGVGFAELQPDGSMKKTGIRPKPFQVEMPLACVLPDIIQLSLSELLKKKEQEMNQEIQVEPNLTWWDVLTKYAGGSIKSIVLTAQEYLPKKYQFSSEILEVLISIVDDGLTKSAYEKEEQAKKRTEELKQKKAESIQKVESEETALRHTINCFNAIIHQLEITFPTSRF